MDIRGRKRKLFAYGMKAFYLIGYTDGNNLEIQWHDRKLSRKYACASKHEYKDIRIYPRVFRQIKYN